MVGALRGVLGVLHTAGDIPADVKSACGLSALKVSVLKS
jgi:hypothetical protein